MGGFREDFWEGGLSKCTRIRPLWGGETGEGKLPQPGDPRRGSADDGKCLPGAGRCVVTPEEKIYSSERGGLGERGLEIVAGPRSADDGKRSPGAGRCVLTPEENSYIYIYIYI